MLDFLFVMDGVLWSGPQLHLQGGLLDWVTPSNSGLMKIESSSSSGSKAQTPHEKLKPVEFSGGVYSQTASPVALEGVINLTGVYVLRKVAFLILLISSLLANK